MTFEQIFLGNHPPTHTPTPTHTHTLSHALSLSHPHTHTHKARTHIKMCMCVCRLKGIWTYVFRTIIFRLNGIWPGIFRTNVVAPTEGLTPLVVGVVSSNIFAFGIFKTWQKAGSPNWRGKLSTDDLLSLTSLDKLPLILLTLFTFSRSKRFLWGGQQYWAVPFS